MFLKADRVVEVVVISGYDVNAILLAVVGSPGFKQHQCGFSGSEVEENLCFHLSVCVSESQQGCIVSCWGKVLASLLRLPNY